MKACAFRRSFILHLFCLVLSLGARAAETDTDPIQVNSVWQGEGNRRLVIVQRSGETFLGRYSSRDFIRDVTGSVKNDRISWLSKDVRAIRGKGLGGDSFGSIQGDHIDFTWHNAQGKSGAFTLRRVDLQNPLNQNAKPILKAECPGGTNYGVGGTGRVLTLTLEYDRDLIFEARWVGAVGNGHRAGDPVVKSVHLSPEHTKAVIKIKTEFFRTNGATQGVIDAGHFKVFRCHDLFSPSIENSTVIATGVVHIPGELRGWATSIKEPNGKVLARAASAPEFKHFAN